MNGKFILIMFLCINLATLVGSSVCEEQVNTCKFGNNIILELIIPSGDIVKFQNDPTITNGSGFNQDLTGKIGEITQAQGAGTSTDTNIFGFVDVILMVLGLITLLTPIPFITFMIAAGLPLIAIVAIGIIPIFLYVLSIMEFIRGASF